MFFTPGDNLADFLLLGELIALISPRKTSTIRFMSTVGWIGPTRLFQQKGWSRHLMEMTIEAMGDLHQYWPESIVQVGPAFT